MELRRLGMTRRDVVRAIGDFETWEADPRGSGLFRTTLTAEGRLVIVIFVPDGEDFVVLAVREG